MKCWRDKCEHAYAATAVPWQISGQYQCQYLNIAVVVSSMTAEARVDQHSIQPIDLGLSLGLRHEGPQVQILQILHILTTTQKLLNDIRPQSNLTVWQTVLSYHRHITDYCSTLAGYLCDFPSSEVRKALQSKREHIGTAVNGKSLRGCDHLFAPGGDKCSH